MIPWAQVFRRWLRYVWPCRRGPAIRMTGRMPWGPASRSDAERTRT